MYICFMRSAGEIWAAADCARADVLGQVLARVLFAGAVLMKHEVCLSQVRSVCSGCSLQLQAPLPYVGRPVASLRRLHATCHDGVQLENDCCLSPSTQIDSFSPAPAAPCKSRKRKLHSGNTAHDLFRFASSDSFAYVCL